MPTGGGRGGVGGAQKSFLWRTPQNRPSHPPLVASLHVAWCAGPQSERGGRSTNLHDAHELLPLGRGLQDCHDLAADAQCALGPGLRGGGVSGAARVRDVCEGAGARLSASTGPPFHGHNAGRLQAHGLGAHIPGSRGSLASTRGAMPNTSTPWQRALALQPSPCPAPSTPHRAPPPMCAHPPAQPRLQPPWLLHTAPRAHHHPAQHPRHTPVDTHCERHGTPAQPRPQPPWPPPGTLRCAMAHHPPAPRPPRPPRHPRRSLCGKRAGMARADARVWAPVGCTSGSCHSCVAAARPCCPPLPPFKHLHPPPPPKNRCSSNAYCPLSTRTHARTVCP